MYAAYPLCSRHQRLTIIEDNLTWKCLRSLCYVRDLFRHFYGLIGSYCCVAH